MTAETDGADATDPSSSALAHFGHEVRLEREALGVSRDAFGKEATCGYSMVAKVEQGMRVPPREFAEACDRVFPHANGRFMRLWPVALKYAYPVWFRRYVELEEKATHLRVFSPLLVPGLVQTREYAREVLKAGRPEDLDDKLTLRMERQRVLTKDDPPRLWIILSEYALRRTSVGDAAVMHGQLQRLMDVAETPRHVVQLLPERAGYVHGGDGRFSILSFHDGADVVHVDAFPTGYIVADADDVADAQHAYDLLKASALPPNETAPLIDQIMKDLHA